MRRGLRDFPRIAKPYARGSQEHDGGTKYVRASSIGLRIKPWLWRGGYKQHVLACRMVSKLLHKHESQQFSVLTKNTLVEAQIHIRREFLWWKESHVYKRMQLCIKYKILCMLFCAKPDRSLYISPQIPERTPKVPDPAPMFVPIQNVGAGSSVFLPNGTDIRILHTFLTRSIQNLRQDRLLTPSYGHILVLATQFSFFPTTKHIGEQYRWRRVFDTFWSSGILHLHSSILGTISCQMQF